MNLGSPLAKMHGNCFHSAPMPVKFNKLIKQLFKVTSSACTKQLGQSNRLVTDFIFKRFTIICQPVQMSTNQTWL